MLSACGGKKKQVEEKGVFVPPPHLEFAAADSEAVKALANEYLMLFQQKDYHSASNLLYNLKNDSVVELNDAERTNYMNTMRQLPNYGVKLKGIEMLSEKRNRLIYLLQVTPNGSLDKEVGIMRFVLTPVRRNGQWYLTIYDPEKK